MTDPVTHVFFADLHHPGGVHEEIESLFDEMPASTKRIFLLGDIFHVWVNEPDFINERYERFLSRLKSLADDGVDLFFIEGNRDFLASRYFEDQDWIDVLLNPSIIDIGGRAVYVGHGDELCWNDWAYQAYKTFIRSRPMRFAADTLPAAMQRSIAERMASASKRLVASKTRNTLAVPPRAYEQVIASGVDAIVHGHIHDTYQRQVAVAGRVGTIYCFGWKDDKRNLIHFDG